MSSIYNLYKHALVNDINNKMGRNYVSLHRSIIDDLEITYADELGKDKLHKLQLYYGVDE